MSNHIHPSAIVGPGVELGDNNIVGPGAVLYGPLRIGDDNWIGPAAIIGTPGEIRGGRHNRGWLEADTGPGVRIGDRNVIREGITIQAGDRIVTTVGSDCYLMTKCHIPHDADIGNRVTIACGVLVGGHSIIGDDVNLGLNSTLHQFTVVGPGVMLGMASNVTRNLPPYAMAYGNPARVRGVNGRGLLRRGASEEAVAQLGRALEEPDIEVPADFAPAFEWYQQAIERVKH